MASAHKHALVVGASGLLGTHLVDHLERDGNWQVTTLSRSAPARAGSHVALDLEDRDACMASASAFSDITHVFYGSRAVRPGYRIDLDANQAMLANLCEAVIRGNGGGVHVQLVHGLKWYGFNLGPAPTPAREETPAHPDASFYLRQRDYIGKFAADASWTWSTVRPHLICAVARNSPSNIVSVIGTLAAVLKEQGEPLWFPGTEAAFNARITVSGITLLCRQMSWIASTPSCHGEDFNTVNGDVMSWRALWPEIAAGFGMEAGGVRPVRLVEYMQDKEAQWSEITRRHGLTNDGFASMCDWSFADASLGLGWDQEASSEKLRTFGFKETVDTRAMFLDYLEQYRQRKLLPTGN